ncbi:uncharacterized protein LOC142978296 [Anticarsia gemmatalis]|uniref:uncharacterized protein LOC142978296 n=1 Tax=Anticarsia gemmatalis TaxID=129554 RepID=UPI003F76672C
MSSPKVLLCDLCIILLFGLNLVLAQEKNSNTAAPDDTVKGNCTCGGFSSSTLDDMDQPLLSQMPGLVVKCDMEGEGTCKSLCNALATATKAKGPEVLCNRLKNANELKLSAFAKVCDRPWAYADLTADEPLCCEESKVKICASAAEKNSTTENSDVKAL